MVLVAGVRWASCCKDAGSPGSGTTGATEDAAARRPARPCGTVSIPPNLLTLEADEKLVEAHRDSRRESDADAGDAQDAAHAQPAAASRLLERAADPAACAPGEEKRRDPAERSDGDRPHGIEEPDACRLARHENRSRDGGDRDEPGQDGERRSVITASHTAVRSRPRASVAPAYCFLYGLPSAAGGTVRPITPATAISVRTYGSAWKSVAAEPE
jgi:hypothetical protein